MAAAAAVAANSSFYQKCVYCVRDDRTMDVQTNVCSIVCACVRARRGQEKIIIICSNHMNGYKAIKDDAEIIIMPTAVARCVASIWQPEPNSVNGVPILLL